MGAAWEVGVIALEEVVVLVLDVVAVLVVVLDDEDGPRAAAKAGLKCDWSPFI